VVKIPRRFLPQSDVAGAPRGSGHEFPCPCCGYLVHDEPPGSYDICPICGWEDDISQLRFPRTGGANRASLIEAQRHFAREDAQDPDSTAAAARAVGALREPEWRPIHEEIDNIEEPTRGVEYGMSYPADSSALYYWRTTFWRSAP
jgi:hypothetical protein